MANTHITLTDLFTGIADVIRAKKNSTETLVADAFPTEIENLRIGFDYNNHSVTSIPDYAFYGYEDLNSVDCYNLTSIGASAFENCTNLKSVILYEGVTTIGEYAFKGCSKDLIIYYKGSSIPETWHDNWNPDNRPVLYGEPIETWDISATSKDNVTAHLRSVGNDYVLYISGGGAMKRWGLYTVKWQSHDSQISSAVIFDGVTNIGNNAFAYCTNLKSTTIPDSVTSIGGQVFYGCKSLMSVTIPDSITSIDMNTFKDCSSLTSVTIGNSVTSIGDSAFYNCTSLKSITIPNSVTSIEHLAFAQCDSLTSVTIGDSVTSIGDWAFYRCTNLKSVTIPDSVTSIGSDAFAQCDSLTSVTIPNSVTSIGDSAFRDCSRLTSMTIGNGVTSIGDEAFYNCTSLTSATIPNSVTSIGDSAFKNCFDLIDISYLDTITQWQAITFGSSWNSSTGTYTIHCTDGDIAKDGTITYH